MVIKDSKGHRNKKKWNESIFHETIEKVSRDQKHLSGIIKNKYKPMQEIEDKGCWWVEGDTLTTSPFDLTKKLSEEDKYLEIIVDAKLIWSQDLEWVEKKVEVSLMLT